MPMKPMVPLLLTVLASAGQNQYLPPTFFTNAIPIKIQTTDVARVGRRSLGI
jgi:hypothetical protein